MSVQPKSGTGAFGKCICEIQDIYDNLQTAAPAGQDTAGGKEEAMPDNRIYIAIDLKSFYASVECQERGLDPLTTHLVVADESRTTKTICLAVSPSLKAYGIGGRARLFEVVQRVKAVNAERRRQLPDRTFTGASSDELKLRRDPSLELTYIAAPPRMAYYMEYSTRVYKVYLKYIAPEDIHVYSIDEVFMDVTDYLATYQTTPEELAARIMKDVLVTTGITATAGIGTNLYLCKIAMDIVAKHATPDENGARIARLDEMSYRRLLWEHQPLTDFWRVGKGYARKLNAYGMYTMGDIARCSLGKPGDYYNEDLLYRLFGVNAELLIDHAWGWEPCTIREIKEYKPENSSICSGQVLQMPYTYEKGRMVVREMADQLALELVDKGLVTDQLVLTVGYDIENLTDPKIKKLYKGPVTTDGYGRRVPKHAHGTTHLSRQTSSAAMLMEAATQLYERIMNPHLLIRRFTLVADHVVGEDMIRKGPEFEQMDLFTDYEARQRQEEEQQQALEKEKKMQKAMLDIKKKYGKNAVLKGMNLQEGATARDRNGRIGGHKA